MQCQFQPNSVTQEWKRGWKQNTLIPKYHFHLVWEHFKAFITFHSIELWKHPCVWCLWKSHSSLHPSPVSSLLCPASFSCLSLTVVFSHGLKNANSFKRSHAILLASVTFHPKILRWISPMMCLCVWWSVNHEQIRCLEREFICKHTHRCLFCLCVPLAPLSLPLMGVQVQPSVKDKGTFWLRQIALEQDCSLPPPPPAPCSPHTYTHTRHPFPSRVTRKVSTLGP